MFDELILCHIVIVNCLKSINQIRVSAAVHLCVGLDLLADLKHKLLQKICKCEQCSVFGGLEILVQAHEGHILLEHSIQIVCLDKGSRLVVALRGGLPPASMMVVVSRWSLHIYNYYQLMF